MVCIQYSQTVRVGCVNLKLKLNPLLCGITEDHFVGYREKLPTKKEKPKNKPFVYEI